MKHSARTTVLLIAATLVNGCGESDSLELVQWRLAELPIQPGAVPADAYFMLDAGPPQRISGSTGCNRFVGNYMVIGSRFEVGTLSMTRMACPEWAEQERAFQLVLQAARRWRIANERLELLDDQGQLLARFAVEPGR